MGHSIHKHMNSFKAKNLLSEMPIDNRASALEMKKGSAAYMKDDMAPKMESPMEKALVGKQKNLPEALKAKIEASPAEMKGSPAHKYDRVVLGGNKGDVSKTKPGKKDFK